MNAITATLFAALYVVTHSALARGAIGIGLALLIAATATPRHRGKLIAAAYAWFAILLVAVLWLA